MRLGMLEYWTGGNVLLAIPSMKPHLGVSCFHRVIRTQSPGKFKYKVPSRLVRQGLDSAVPEHCSQRSRAGSRREGLGARWVARPAAPGWIARPPSRLAEESLSLARAARVGRRRNPRPPRRPRRSQGGARRRKHARERTGGCPIAGRFRCG